MVVAGTAPVVGREPVRWGRGQRAALRDTRAAEQEGSLAEREDIRAVGRSRVGEHNRVGGHSRAVGRNQAGGQSQEVEGLGWSAVVEPL